MAEYEPAERLELPPAPRSLWDFVGVLAPVLKYYVALLLLFLGARWFNRQLDKEAAAEERPTLSTELNLESDEEEEEEEEEIEELVTDGDRLVPLDATVKKQKKKSKDPSKELFEGLQKVERELREKKDKEEAEDDVSWNELHSSMLRRYKDKYPEHGPRVADPETDRYDEEFNELLREHNIDPEELKSQSAKKAD